MVSCDAFNFPYKCRADTVTRGIRCYITGAQLAIRDDEASHAYNFSIDLGD